LGSKMILDATRGENKEGSVSPPNSDLVNLKRMDPAILDCRNLENSLLIIKTHKNGRALVEKLSERPELASFKIVALVGADVPLNDPVLLIWGLFTRFDCAQDTFFARTSLVRGHPHYEGPLLIDATMKDGYPEPLSMTGAFIDLVDQNWEKYGFKEKIPSPNRA
jgi:hypothetical protein